MKRLFRFLRLPPADRRLFIEAAGALTIAGLLLRIFPFARLSRRLGTHMAESPEDEAPSLTATAGRVQWAVETAARILPWNPVCLPQAVAATRMLQRRGIASTLYLGIDPAADYDAHAWVRVGDVIVTGGPSPDRFSVVSSFA
jgi:hypothetical protein